jgi:hypothetical protein
MIFLRTIAAERHWRLEKISPRLRAFVCTSVTSALALVLIGACGACRDSTTGIRTEFVGSYAFSATERRTIARVAGFAARDARPHLPALASQNQK